HRGKIAIYERPSPSASVVATIDGEEMDDWFELVDSSGAFLRVSGSRKVRLSQVPVEGWVRWGDVLPDQFAMAVDTRTGAVVARLPLAGLMSRMVFSPDGSRALVYGVDTYDNPLEGTDTVYEVRTSDLSITRTIDAPHGRDGTVIAAAY